MVTTRQERERAFHNAAFSDLRRKSLTNVYSILHDSRIFYEDFVRRRAPGARLLEYGCGSAAVASLCGKFATEIVGIDISDVAVRQASEQAENSGLTNARYQVMDAEHLDFPDQSFDLICSVAILHHLDLRRAYSEIARVLTPQGSAIFMEPLGHNPAINLYRRLTPTLRTPDEHPFRWADLTLAREYFDNVELRFFAFASLLAIPLNGYSFFRPVLLRLEQLDRVLLKAPLLKRYAWQVVIVLSAPKQPVGTGSSASTSEE